MRFLLAVSRAIDAANSAIGKGISWLLLVAIFISAINAVMRKAFSMSSNAWLESQWYLFSAVFLIDESKDFLAALCFFPICLHHCA